MTFTISVAWLATFYFILSSFFTFWIIVEAGTELAFRNRYGLVFIVVSGMLLLLMLSNVGMTSLLRG